MSSRTPKGFLYRRCLSRTIPGRAAAAAVALLLALVACEAPVAPAPAPPPPAPPGPPIISSTGSNITAPGSVIVTGGTTHNDSAPKPTSLAAVVKDGKGYLYHPDLGDVQLSDETSALALAHIVFGAAHAQAAAGRLEPAADDKRPGYGYGKTDTGLRVRQRERGQYIFKNPTKRWQAVVSPVTGRPQFVAKSNFNLLLLQNYSDRVFVQVDGRDLETYADVTPGLTLVVGNRVVIRGLSARNYNRAIADGADSAVFAKMTALQIATAVKGALTEVAGIIPGVDCVNAILLNSVATALEQHLHSIITDEDRRAHLPSVVKSALEPSLKCALELAGPASPVVTAIVTVYDTAQGLIWTTEQIAGVIGAIFRDAYGTVEGNAGAAPQPPPGAPRFMDLDGNLISEGTDITYEIKPPLHGTCPNPACANFYETLPRATDRENDSIKYSVTGHPEALLLQQPGDGSMYPYLYGDPRSEGDYYVEYRATDRGGNWSDIAFRIRVVPSGSLLPLTFGPLTVSDQMYTVDTAITTLTLPHASGGTGQLAYNLVGRPRIPPGLSFDSTTRKLSGTPSAAGEYRMTYTATDTRSRTVALSFRVTVEGGSTGCALTPTPPSDPTPANGATGVSLNPTLSWSNGDSRCGNAITYQVHFVEVGKTRGPWPLSATRSAVKSLRLPGDLPTEYDLRLDGLRAGQERQHPQRWTFMPRPGG